MIVLGINAYHADSSACILIDGVVKAAIEEERITRIKHWSGFPTQSILFCLNETKLKLGDVDYVTIGRDPKAKFFAKIKYLIFNPRNLISLFVRLVNLKKINSIESELKKIDASFKGEICNIEHHRAHLACSFFASPFDESLIVSIDGSGDFSTTMFAYGKGNKIKVLDSIDFPNSLGIFYTSLTQWLGFLNYGDEYKVMGLAPYGKPIYTDKIRNLIIFEDDGKFKLNTKYFIKNLIGAVHYEGNIPIAPRLYNKNLINLIGPNRLNNKDVLTQYHKDIASSVQKVCEEVIFHILNGFNNNYNIKNICISGGIAQNSVANGKIIEKTKFTNLYVPSAGHDAGISIGSALYLYNHVLENPRSEPIYHSYFGSSYSNTEIYNILKKTSLNFEKCPDEKLFDKVADYLINDGVVGWFSGKCEFGPRALGARSILADPSNVNAKELINSKIKRRESFRPFAPSILEDYVEDYFENTDNVPFMEKVFKIKSDKQKIIPSVTHIDGTGRLQTVSKKHNHRYYNLIEAFYKKSGVPILLNTSFNENEPIVNKVEEAIDCFARTKMDVLVLENYIITR